MISTPLDNEKLLLKLIANGDQASYKIVFKHYWNRIYATAFTFTKSPELSEDIAQDIFAQLWVKRTALSDINNFEAYLYTTARNRIIDILRKKVFIPENESYLAAYFKETSASPEGRLEFKDFESAIHEAIDKLPVQQQTAFRLSRFQGYNHEEIAGKMGLSKETVKSYIVRALVNLRKQLQQHDSILLALPVLYFFEKNF